MKLKKASYDLYKRDRVYPAFKEKLDRMIVGEGIDPVQVYERATEKYQKGIKDQGCCWYMFCDIAVFDRTDHVEEPMTPPATEPEPSRAHVPDESDFEEPVPYDWLYDLGDGIGAKARAAYRRLPRAKRLAYPVKEAFIRGGDYPEVSSAMTDPSPATAVISDLTWDHEVEISQLRLVQSV